MHWLIGSQAAVLTAEGSHYNVAGIGSLAQAAVLTAEGSHYNVAGIVLSMLTRCNGSPALHCAAGKQFTGSDTDFKVTVGMHRSCIQA